MTPPQKHPAVTREAIQLTFEKSVVYGGNFAPLKWLAEQALDERDEALREVERLKREIENLTPGGSEFHDNIERCLSFLRDRGEFTKKKVLELAAEKRRAAAYRKIAIDLKTENCDQECFNTLPGHASELREAAEVSEETDFLDGMIAALAVVYRTDNPVLFDEIVGMVDREALIKQARKARAMKWSGLNDFVKRQKP